MRVAIVSYYSPPQAAIASHRVLRMTRALLAAGHQVHWITADAGRFTDGIDPSLGALIPAEVVVHRIDGQALITKPAAANLWEKLRRTLAWHAPRRFAWPDSFLSWRWRLGRSLPALCARHEVEAVLVCCSPHNQLLALPALRRRCPEVRILVDYRDLLSGNPWNLRSPGIRRRLVDLERKILRAAEVLFLNTESARDRFLATVGEVPGLDVDVMRNVADYALADAVRDGTGGPVDLGPGVHLGFFGALFPRRRLLTVLRAIAAMPPASRERLRLHVFTDRFGSAALLDEDLEAIGKDLGGVVCRPAQVDYQQALRTMAAMDALLLINGSEASDAVFVPGKVFDYLMARRPILFVGHPGEASAIVARTNGDGWCFDAENVDGVRQKLEQLLDVPVPSPEPSLEFGPEVGFAPLLRRLG